MLPTGTQIQGSLLDGELKGLQNQGIAFKKNVNSDHAALVSAAKNFESFMMSFMYKQMYSSIPKSEALGKHDAQDMFMGLYMDEVSKKASAGQNGIADLMVKQYEKHLKSSGDENNADLSAISTNTENLKASLSTQIKTVMNEDTQTHTVQNLFKDFSGMIGKISDKLTSKFGMREHPILGGERMHAGVDLGLESGTKVNVPAAGKVVFAGKKGGYGNTVIVDHGQGVESVYAHLNEILVKDGEKIGKNGAIGTVGSTGLSTGPHLHFEVRKDGKSIDPMHLGLCSK